MAAERASGKFAKMVVFALLFAFLFSSTSNSNTIIGGSHRGLLNIGSSPPIPETVQIKVPKLLHLIWVGEDPPEYVLRTKNFTTQRANEQGFDVIFWKDKEVDELIRSRYPWLIKTWDKLLGIPIDTSGRGTRLADFLRIVVVHAFGGVYLDMDFIPCRDLNGFIGEPGFATFPWPHLERKAISNGLFSAPAGHQVLQIALEKMAANDRITIDPILHSTGPTLLARSVTEHFKRLGETPLKANPGGPDPWNPRGSVWFEEPKTLTRFGVRKRPLRNMMHLEYMSWIPKMKNNPSPCETKVDLIEPFLESRCNALNVATTKWRKCGYEPKKTTKYMLSYGKLVPVK